MKDYNVIFVDGQYLLHRNWSMVQKNHRTRITTEDGELNCGTIMEKLLIRELVRSFLYSLRKILRAYSCNKVILLWDTRPYHNAVILENISGDDTYKADRVYEYDEIGDQLFRIRNFAGYFIRTKLTKFGIHSYKRSGWEADFLARIGALVSRPGEKNALASSDSDWTYYMTPNCPELINLRTYNLTYYDKVVENCLGADPWFWEVHHSSFYGSHNNLVKTVTDEYYRQEFEDTLKMYQEGTDLDKVFTDFKLLVAQIQSWNIEGFPDYEEVCTEMRQLMDEPNTLGTDVEWHNLHLGLGSSYYNEIKGILQ